MSMLNHYKNASKWGLLILLMGLLITAGLAWQIEQKNTLIIEQALREKLERLSTNIIERMTLYQYGLRGARGAITTAGEHNISRTIFHSYSLTRDVEKEFTGARGFGFIRRVSSADEAEFLASAKQDNWPDFKIRQLNPHEGEKYVIQYIEPVEGNQAAVGLDIASEKSRKEAADSAVMSGEARLTAPITLVQKSGQTQQSFLILLPIYRTNSVPDTKEKRLSEAYGWSYAPLVTNEVLTGLSINPHMTQLRLSDVTDIKSPIHFFETNKDNNIQSLSYSLNLTKEVFGRKWQLELIAYPAFVQSLNLTKPSLWLLIGSLFSLMLGTLTTIWSLNSLRKQQIQVEQARQASMVEHSLDGIISLNLQGQITSWNKGAEQLFGYSQTDVLGELICSLIVPHRRVPDEEKRLIEVVSGKAILNHLSRHRRQDGQELMTSTTILPLYDERGFIVGASQTIRDITAQEEAKQNILNLNSSLEKIVAKRTQSLQQALLENQTLLDTINQQLLYSVTDPQGTILEVNDNFCRASGFPREVLVGKNHSLLKSGEHDKLFWRTMWSQIKSGQSWHGEICNYDRNKQFKWFDTIISPAFNEYGEIERFIALRIDITARKLAQIEKNDLGILLSSVLDAASEMSIIATDVQGNITIFNRGAERLLGYSAVEMIGQSTPAPLHLPEEVMVRSAELSTEYAKDIQGFDVFTYKARVEGSETRNWTYVRKDGSQFQVSLSVTAMRDNVGEIIGYLGIGVDISQILLQKEALVTVSNHLSKAAEVAQLGIWSWDLLQNSLDWNSRMFTIYDQPESLREQGLTYEHWYRRVHPDDIANADAKLKAAIEGTQQYDPIFRVVRTDGSIRYVQAAAQVERDKQGNATKVVGINLDITERQQVEETLKNAKLEADAASAAKSAFLANMSHEIRTPMNAVLGMLQLIQHTSLSSQQQDYINKTQIAAKSLLGLLNDILDFSKMDAGKLALDLHPCSIELLMRDLAVVLSGNHGNKDVEVMFDLDSALPPWLLADQLRLQQVLVNLAGNALKFTRQGQVIVSIECLRLDTDSVTVKIAITDTGIGISDEQIGRIFTGFEQAESSTSRRFGGSGLGLAISKRLVELMGGQLQVTSELGVGSCFWFDVTFPITTAEETSKIDLSGYRILVVDDHPLTAEILHKNLTGFGCEVETAFSGNLAIAMVQQADGESKPFDAVLMDWRMPEIDGLQTAEMLRNLHPDSDTPVVVMLTAYGHDVIAKSQHNKNVPFVNFLTKPVTSQVLAETMLNAIEGKTIELPPQPRLQRLLVDLNILVVEDNQLNRQVIEELLGYEGANVVLAEDGEKGVALVLESENAFDIVIMDMQMPVMDGLEATRRIRADGRFATLPILAMTANASESDRQECLNAGMNDHVGKPIDMPLLLPSILRLVGREYTSIKQDDALFPEAVTDQDDEQLLDDIDLILRRFGGDKLFFQKMAKSFAPEMNKQLILFTEAIQRFDYSNAAAISHAIKGIASNFGARGLAAYAAFIEKQFKQASSEPIDIKCWADKLEELIEQSSLQLSRYGDVAESGEGTHVQQTNPIDSSALAQSVKVELNHLMILLQENNLEAMTLVDRLADSLSGHPQWSALNEQVQALEFEGAIATLSIILESK
ncbi:PAS domain S-box protein [Shewanella oncorhynchi]|uniref:PAS domain S-box protein n=1 Tax=Shewanella oncorhynchi TaxID=2726434 RepID=UPI003D7A312F